MNLETPLAVIGAGTASLRLLQPPAAVHSNEPLASPSDDQRVYMLSQDFGAPQTTAVFAQRCATIRPDPFMRQTVVDLDGTIAWFRASNISAVLAQSGNLVSLPRKVFLKGFAELAETRNEAFHAFVASDPFISVYSRLQTVADAKSEEPGEVPSTIAVARARAVVEAACAEHVVPKKILRSASGGVFVYFTDAEKYAEIECDSDGDILMVLTDRARNPEPWLSGLDRLRQDMATVRAFLV